MSDARIAVLEEEARRLGQDSPERAAALTEAVRLAESMGDHERAFDLRLTQIDALNWAGMPDEMLVAFAAAVRWADRNQRGTEHVLLWYFKWVLLEGSKQPRVPKARLWTILDDFAARIDSIGGTQRAVEHYRCLLHCHFGELEEALAAHERWRKLRRDQNCDCNACERDHQVMLMVRTGEYARALKLAKPLLERRLSCLEVPRITYGMVLTPLLARGDLEEAERCHQRGYPMVRGKTRAMDCVGQHLEYLAATCRLERGLEVFAHNIRRAHLSPSAWNRLAFFDGAARLFEAFAAKRGDQEMRVSLPADFPHRNALARYAPSALKGVMQALADDCADAIAKRNGNLRLQEVRARKTAILRDTLERVG